MEISSISNPRVKEWRKLLQKKYRDEQGRFLVEGVHLVQEAIRAQQPIEAILFSSRHGLPRELETNSNCEVIAVSEEIIQKCSSTSTPQPVIAVIQKVQMDLKVSRSAKTTLILALDRVQDPGNVGTLLRSAAATNAEMVLVGEGSADIYNPKTLRASMGALFHMPVQQVNLPQVLDELIQLEPQLKIVGTDVASGQSCYEYDWLQPTIVVIGNEGEGLSAEIRSKLKSLITIPMSGRTESLNAAMAGTLLLFEAQRHKMKRTIEP